MLFASFALLATLIPAMASHGQPAHLRHRHLAVRQSQEELAARSDISHAEAHRVIKRTVNKRGQQCRPRGQSKPSFSSAAASPASSAPAAPTSEAVYSQAESAPTPSSAAPPPPPPSSAVVESQAQPSPSADAGNSGGAPSWGVLAVTDSACGWSGADAENPNGSEDWINCGLNGGGWTPPHVDISQLVAADLDASDVFAPCGQYIDKFKQYAGEFNVHPIMLASFAMQESTCNAGATGGNGEAGLMQIAPPNCEAGHNCWDVDYNIRRGAQLFRQMIDANGGNVFAAIGAYNGWRIGLTQSDATAAKWQGNCHAQNNLDYVYQFCNGWMQNKNAYSMGTYFNLRDC